MKILTKRILVAVAIIAAPFVIWFAAGIVEVIRFVHYMGSQMEAGRTYMDSLSESQIESWIQRSEKLLASAPTNASPIRSTPVPEDLAALKILRVDVDPPDCVSFVWVGGMDHTYLLVQRQSNGTHRLIANYNDEEPERQLWPREDANQ